jgi:hypothetical protein
VGGPEPTSLGGGPPTGRVTDDGNGGDRLSTAPRRQPTAGKGRPAVHSPVEAVLAGSYAALGSGADDLVATGTMKSLTNAWTTSRFTRWRVSRLRQAARATPFCSRPE